MAVQRKTSINDKRPFSSLTTKFLRIVFQVSHLLIIIFLPFSSWPLNFDALVSAQSFSLPVYSCWHPDYPYGLEIIQQLIFEIYPHIHDWGIKEVCLSGGDENGSQHYQRNKRLVSIRSKKTKDLYKEKCQLKKKVLVWRMTTISFMRVKIWSCVLSFEKG